MGQEVPRNLAEFSSVIARSYAIILLCIWRVKLGPVLACFTPVNGWTTRVWGTIPSGQPYHGNSFSSQQGLWYRW